MSCAEKHCPPPSASCVPTIPELQTGCSGIGRQMQCHVFRPACSPAPLMLLELVGRAVENSDSGHQHSSSWRGSCSGRGCTYPLRYRLRGREGIDYGKSRVQWGSAPATLIWHKTLHQQPLSFPFAKTTASFRGQMTHP